MKNQVFTGTPTSRRFALCPTTVKAGDFVFLGQEPAFALDDYQSVSAGTTFLLNGTFATTVVGQTAESPSVAHKINPGDKLYGNGGSLDATTNVTTGVVIDANSAGTFIGYLDPNYVAVGSGLTDTNAQVMITLGA